MTTAAEMLRRLRSVDILQEVGEAIEQTKEEAIKANQAQLFLKGEKSDETALKPYKSEAYAKRKRAMRGGVSIVDAYLTGSMYRGMFVDVRDTVVVFDSLAPSATFMIERDGPKIFGLSKPSKDAYANFYMPLVQRSIKKQTGCI